MFGNYSNRVNRRNFIANLGSHGWKYFNFYSLNGIFVQKFNEQTAEERGEVFISMFKEGLRDKFGKLETPRYTVKQTF